MVKKILITATILFAFFAAAQPAQALDLSSKNNFYTNKSVLTKTETDPAGKQRSLEFGYTWKQKDGFSTSAGLVGSVDGREITNDAYLFRLNKSF